MRHFYSVAYTMEELGKDSLKLQNETIEKACDQKEKEGTLVPHFHQANRIMYLGIALYIAKVKKIMAEHLKPKTFSLKSIFVYFDESRIGCTEWCVWDYHSERSIIGLPSVRYLCLLQSVWVLLSSTSSGL